jgi:hypothetical protein
MAMKKSAIAILLFSAQFSFASGPEICPKLPEKSGLRWVYNNGPDFDVCYAVPLDAKEAAFGIYIGNHPDFDSRQAKAVANGSVAGRSATWYSAPEIDSRYSRQTIVVLNEEHRLVAHIWISANSQKSLENYLSILKEISFKD